MFPSIQVYNTFRLDTTREVQIFEHFVGGYPHDVRDSNENSRSNVNLRVIFQKFKLVSATTTAWPVALRQYTYLSMKLILFLAAFLAQSCASTALSVSSSIHGQVFHGGLGRQLLPTGCFVHFYTQQKLDHFNEDDDRVFSQRFIMCSNFTVSDNAPVIVYLGGEAPEHDDRAFTSQVYGEFARSVGGVIVSLEHRYYGLSYPAELPDASTENLKYLSSEQALADIKQFILYLKSLQGNQADNASSPPLKLPYSLADSKVAVAGGSYPGSLAAWMKLKHGDVISGAISNSAPVLAQVDFHGIWDVFADNVKVEAIGGSQACFDFWDNAMYLYASRAMESFSKVPSWLRPCDKKQKRLSAEEASALAQSVLSSSEVITQNYVDFIDPRGTQGVRRWCQVAEKYSQEKSGTWKALRDIVYTALKIPANSTCIPEGDMPDDSQTNDLSWPVTLDDQSKMAMRLWMYQVCTEFGWLQGFYGYDRSQPPAWKFMTLYPEFDIQASAKDCSVFGKDFTFDRVENAVEKTNEIYGGRTLEVTNVTFVNGNLDPWKLFAIRPEDEPDYNYCPDGGFTGNSSFCVENPDLTQSTMTVPLGSHCLWMSALSREYSFLNPQLVSELVSTNSKVFKDLRSYLGISG